MMFYAFAMQCASTVAVVYRETKRLALASCPVRLHDGAGLRGKFDNLSPAEVGHPLFHDKFLPLHKRFLLEKVKVLERYMPPEAAPLIGRWIDYFKCEFKISRNRNS
jgi:hypothetical protein